MATADYRAKPYNQWLLIAANVEVRRRTGGPAPVDAIAIREHLSMITRGQFALDLSFDRMKSAQFEIAAMTIEGGDRLLLNDVILRAFLEAHAFLVSTALFWNSVTTLATHFESPELDAAIQENAPAIERAKTARHHMEHVSERIEKGRGERFGAKMTAHDFRQAIGAVEGDEVFFGPERFDLREMQAATHRITEAVAAKVNEGLRVTFSPRE